MKLYLPYGNMKGLKGGRQATIHWFVKDREQPVAPYTQLIENYKHLDAANQRRAEQTIDELFTEQEFTDLRLYLYEKHREDVRTGMMVTPVNGIKQANDMNRSLIRPFAVCVDGEGGRFYRLCDESDYALPFLVWGYYTDPRRLLPSRPMQGELGRTG